MKPTTRKFISLLVISGILAIGYGNCAKLTYEGNPTITSDNDNGALGNPNPGTGDGAEPNLPGNPGDLFTRLSSIPVTGGTSTSNQKVKLLLVVDNSKSMRLVHEKLSKSLKSLIVPLKQFHVEIKIITTSEIMKQSGKDLQDQGFDYKSWTYPIGSKPNEEESRILGAQSQETFGIYSYGEYHYLNDKYRMTFTPGDAQIDAKLINLQNMILDISANTNGTSREQGLCNIMLALHDRGPHQFFEKNDVAGVLLISDENDQSYWNFYDTSENRVSCRNSYIHGSLQDPTIDKEVIDDAVNFNVYAARYQISFDYNNDGVIEKRNRADNGGNWLPYATYSHLINDLNTKGSLICPEDFYKNTIQGYASYLASASGGTNGTVVGCKIIPSWTALYGFAPTADNICVGSFSKNGKTYASFAEYLKNEKNVILVPGSCSHYKSKRISYRNFGAFYIKGSEDPETNRPIIKDMKQSQASIKKAILNQAKRLFGKENFFMGNLIHKGNDCIADSAIQSLGVDYMNLFQSTELSDRLISESICESDYSPILGELSSGIVTSIGRTYEVANFKPYEVINRIFLVSGSKKTQLTPDSDYTVSENKFTIDSKVNLANGDILQIEIVSLPE
ncbi:MAG: hypothetical protein JNL11_09050 [Bdellovibrionaceae bacterium]|nr:hypothetical protein [Pseudobdellovibrionaceae bacterium]